MATAFNDRLDKPSPVWPAPDMSVLAAGRRAPAVMPKEMFGTAWPLLSDLAEGAGAPIDYVALGFLTVAASLVGGKRKAKPWATGTWSEPCIIWAAAVGDPSANKSPALDASTGPLGSIEADHADAHAYAVLEWETKCERAKVEQSAWAEDVKTAQKEKLATPTKPEVAVYPDEPVRRRLKVVEATPEAMGSILAGNPSGTLHFRDELAGWLTSFDRYSPGGREFWLEAYGGRPFKIDRKGTKTLDIPFNGVSVLGGIQPEKLSQCLLSGSDDGLVARFLWAWPDAVPFRRPRQLADVSALEALYRRLDSLSWGVDPDGRNVAVTLPLDDRAADVFEAWCRENDQGIEDAGLLYKGFCGKLKGGVLRLALAAELIGWAVSGGNEPKSISARTLGGVIEFVEDYAKPTALRVFGDAALPAVERNAATLARWIIRAKPRKVNARDVRRTARLPGLKEAQAVSDAIALLVEVDWLTPGGTREGDTPGRHSADFIVNPTLHEVYDGQMA